MIPPRPHRRKYLLDPNAHESRRKRTIKYKYAAFECTLLTSFKDHIRHGCGSRNIASGNDGRFVVASALAFAFDRLGERVVLEFFEQHGVGWWLQYKEKTNEIVIIVSRHLNENKNKFSPFRRCLDRMPAERKAYSIGEMRHDMWLARETTFRGHDEQTRRKIDSRATRRMKRKCEFFAIEENFFLSPRESRCRLDDYLIGRRKTFSITLSIFTRISRVQSISTLILVLRSHLSIRFWHWKFSQGPVWSRNYVMESFIIFQRLHNEANKVFHCNKLSRIALPCKPSPRFFMEFSSTLRFKLNQFRIT